MIILIREDQVEIRINGQKAASWNYDQAAEKRITLQYTPAATEDSEIIRQYGSIFETPAYLVQMEPVLCLDGKAETSLTDCTATLGESQKFDICITSGKQTETISNNVTAGSLYAVLLDLLRKLLKADNQDDVSLCACHIG